MNLVRCRDQGSGTLEEFYGRLKGARGGPMLEFLAAFRKLPFDRDVFGLISVYTLRLLDVDSHMGTPWVTVEPTREGVRVCGLLGRPMVGRVDEFREVYRDPKKAAKMALRGMEWSEGWK